MKRFILFLLFLVSSPAFSATVIGGPIRLAPMSATPFSAGSLLPVIGMAAATASEVLNPWIAGLSVGMEIYKLVVADSAGNPIAVTTGNAPWVNTDFQSGSLNGSDWSLNQSTGQLTPNPTSPVQTAPLWWDPYANVSVQSVNGQDVCDAESVRLGHSAGWMTFYQDTLPYGHCRSADGYGYVSIAQHSSPPHCDTGYTYGSGACVLSGTPPMPATMPNVPQRIRPGLLPPGVPQSVTGLDSYGNPVTQTLTPDATGGLSIAQQVQTSQNVNGLPQTYTTTNNIIINNMGQVTSASTVSSPGTLATNTPSNPGAGSAVSVNLNTQGLNQEVTQQKILQDLNNMPPPPVLPTAPPASADTKSLTDAIAAIPASESTLEAMFDYFVWSPPKATCTNPSWAIHGFAPVTIDICTAVGYIRDVLGFLMAIFGAWEIYLTLYRREG